MMWHYWSACLEASPSHWAVSNVFPHENPHLESLALTGIHESTLCAGFWVVLFWKQKRLRLNAWLLLGHHRALSTPCRPCHCVHFLQILSRLCVHFLHILSLCTLPADPVFVYTSCRSCLCVHFLQILSHCVHFLQILSLCTLPADIVFVTAADTQFTSRDVKPNKRRRERTQTRKLYSPKIVVKVCLGLTTGPTN